MFKSSLLAFITLVTVVAAASTSNETKSAVVCPPARNSIALRRMWRADLTSHFYSTYGPEVAAYGRSNYVEEPPQGRLYAVQYDATVPFFRCANNQGTAQVDYLYTADPGEWQAVVAAGCRVTPDPSAAGVAQGIGYLYTAPYCGSVPLYRLYSSSRFDHFYTISPTERQNNINNGLYADEGIAGYVLPN